MPHEAWVTKDNGFRGFFSFFIPHPSSLIPSSGEGWAVGPKGRIAKFTK